MPAPDYATEIAALERGLGLGEARIESEGESVTYRGVADIMAAIAFFEGRAARSNANSAGSHTTYAAFEPN